jgi:hypothetical protein
MREPADHTAEDASRAELQRATLKLGFWLAALLVIGPVIRALPLGQTTRTGILAWVLLILALYWLYAGLGYRPLLLLQVLVYSAAVTLLMLKVLAVALGSNEFDFLRLLGKGLIVVGTAFAAGNLSMMFLSSVLGRAGPGEWKQ